MESEKSKSISDRAQRAAEIARNPSKYKICHGCDSIVISTVDICPSCHSYRFEADPMTVVHQAKRLGRRQGRSVLASDLEA